MQVTRAADLHDMAMQMLENSVECRYEKVEQQKQGMKKAAELERRFAKKDGAGPDGAAADGAVASSDSDSDQDDEDKITEAEEAGKHLHLPLASPCLCRFAPARNKQVLAGFHHDRLTASRTGFALPAFCKAVMLCPCVGQGLQEHHHQLPARLSH